MGGGVSLFLQSQSLSLNLGRALPSSPPCLEDPLTLTFSEERCQYASLLFLNFFIVPLLPKGRQRVLRQRDPLGKHVSETGRRVPGRMGSTEEDGGSGGPDWKSLDGLLMCLH